MEVVGELTFVTAGSRPAAARPSGRGLDEERDMAIAPLLDTETIDWSGDLYGASWPRPALRLVTDQGQGDTDGGGAMVGDVVPGAPPATVARAIVSPLFRAGEDVAGRRARRAAVRRRRRAAVLAAVAAGLMCALAMPLASLAGAPSAAHPNAPAAAVGETVYVVQAGDTLWSIAARFDGGGNPRPMAEALAREIGSAVVVPGERISIP